jgi:biotin carboxyl carrier protein
MRYFVQIEGKEHVADVTELPGGGFDVQLSNADGSVLRAVEVQASGGTTSVAVSVDGRMFDLVIDGEAPKLFVFASGRRQPVVVENAHQRAAASVRKADSGDAGGVVTSPMPGKVVKVLVKEGDAVEPGRPLVVVEAMKMENELSAEIAGTVQKVYVQPGDAVEGGARLVLIG